MAWGAGAPGAGPGELGDLEAAGALGLVVGLEAAVGPAAPGGLGAAGELATEY